MPHNAFSKFFVKRGTLSKGEFNTWFRKLERNEASLFKLDVSFSAFITYSSLLFEIQSFKSFVEAHNKNADQGDYVDDFVDSDAPQFKGKSKKKRVAMAVAAYKSKKEDTDNGS